MRENTQTKAIFDHLTNIGSITSYEAFQLYGVTRLSALIFSLKKQGYDIISEEVEVLNRYGKISRFSKYTLIE